MTRRARKCRPVGSDRAGFTLLEVMIAAILLLVMFFGLAQVHGAARKQMIMEDHRRTATAVLEYQLEAVRRDTNYDALGSLNGRSTQYVIDNLPYTASNAITTAVPEAQAATLAVSVSWPEVIGANAITRTVSGTTILARGLSWN